jgi:hypothetical protein
VNEQNIPRDLQNAAIQYSIDHIRANFEKDKELFNLLEQIQKKCTSEINELLGSKAKDYMMFHEKRREVASNIRPLFSATPEGQKIKSQFKKRRLAEADEFIKNLGINLNDFKSIRKKYQEEARSVIQKARMVEGKSLQAA